MIPEEHKLKCPTCGKIIDMRDLSQVLSHGWMNKETGQYECQDVDVQYSSSRKVGESIEYLKDKTPINVN